MKLACLLFLALSALPLTAQTNAPNPDPEQIRTACIQGRRHICGRILQVTKDGLVIDSGYTSLLQPPWNHSWLTRAAATPPKPGPEVEAAAPDSVAVGLVFLTDLPRRGPKPKQYDYASLIGYPAGNYNYAPATNISKTLRRFAAGLATAVQLNMETKQ